MSSSDDEDYADQRRSLPQLARSSTQLLEGKKVDDSSSGLELVSSHIQLGNTAGASKVVSKGGTTNVQVMKKKKGAAGSDKKVLEKPSEKHETAKLKRVIAYGGAKEEVSRWDTVVHENRQSDRLVFPLQQPDMKLQLAAEVTKRFSNRTSLEKQVSAALGQHGYKQVDDSMFTQRERNALRAMDVREARERRAQLRRHRILLSANEAESRRRKKIKSKRYHRVLRKEENKKAKKAMEMMEKEDPDSFALMKERADKTRMEERMSLKHRGGSKFSKERVQYKKHDVESRLALNTMYEKSRELTKKSGQRVSDSDSSSEEDEPEVPVTTTPKSGAVKASVGNAKNPWMKPERNKPAKTGGTTGGVRAFQLPVVINEEAMNEDDSDDEDDEEEEDNRAVEPGAITKMIGAFDDDNEAANGARHRDNNDDVELSGSHHGEEGSSDNTDSDDGEEDGNGLKDLHKKSIDEIFEAAETGANLDKGKKEKPARKSSKKPSNKQGHDNALGDREDTGLSEGETRLKTLDDIESWAAREAKKDASSVVAIKPSGASKKSDHKEAGRSADIDITSTMKPVAPQPMKSATIDHRHQASAAENADAEGTAHKLTIAEAFADDDVVTEFSARKRAVEERDKPKDIDLTMPGWGSWGGTDIEPSKKKKRRFIIKAAPAPPRKDRKLNNVIISECQDKTADKYKVSQLPFPFAKVSQFESTIRAPVGKAWNTETAFKKLTAPRVVTRAGTVIEPMGESELLASKKREENRAKGFASRNADKIAIM